ncbi:MAG: PAS domain S-box protein [Cyanobacteria bacterium]|nr:PAS domain S-box protein [Cyanobacteriota bacterium]
MQEVQTQLMELCKEKIDIAVEVNSNAALFMGKDGEIISVNRLLLKLFGYSREELVGRDIEILVPERFRGKHIHHRKSFFLDPGPRRMGHGRDLSGRRSDGTEFPVEIGLSPFVTDDGEVAMATVVDISERVKLEKMVKRQQEDLMELSTPVIQLWEGVLVLPVVGTLDSERSRCMMEQLLEELNKSGCGVAIIDISGVPTVDTMVAQHLMKTIDAARLMGAECIISGIRPEIANTIVHLGIDLARVRTKSSMAKALADAFSIVGLKVVKVEQSDDRR